MPITREPIQKWLTFWNAVYDYDQIPLEDMRRANLHTLHVQARRHFLPEPQGEVLTYLTRELKRG